MEIVKYNSKEQVCIKDKVLQEVFEQIWYIGKPRACLAEIWEETQEDKEMQRMGNKMQLL